MRYVKIKDIADKIDVSKPTILQTIKSIQARTKGNKLDYRDLNYLLDVQILRKESKIKPEFLQRLDKRLILELVRSCIQQREHIRI
jgi:transcriptional antiterminator